MNPSVLLLSFTVKVYKLFHKHAVLQFIVLAHQPPTISLLYCSVPESHFIKNKSCDFCPPHVHSWLTLSFNINNTCSPPTAHLYTQFKPSLGLCFAKLNISHLQFLSWQQSLHYLIRFHCTCFHQNFFFFFLCLSEHITPPRIILTVMPCHWLMQW